MIWTIEPNSRRRSGWWYPWNLLAGLFRFWLRLRPMTSYRLTVRVQFDANCLYQLPSNAQQVNKLLRFASPRYWWAPFVYLGLVAAAAVIGYANDEPQVWVWFAVVLSYPLYLALQARNAFGLGWVGDAASDSVQLVWIAERRGVRLRSTGGLYPHRQEWGAPDLGQYGVILGHCMPGFSHEVTFEFHPGYAKQVLFAGAAAGVVLLMPPVAWYSRVLLPYFGGAEKAPQEVSGRLSWQFTPVDSKAHAAPAGQVATA